MMLATRCPYCQTTFRVVQDQLKICNGIVRCGSCRQVFNGIEQLQSADAAAQAMQHQAIEQAKKEPAWPESAQANSNPVTIVAEDDKETGFTEAHEDLKLILTPSEETVEPTSRLVETPDPISVEVPVARTSAVDSPKTNPDARFKGRKEPELVDEIHSDAQHGRDVAEDMTFPRTQLPGQESATQITPIEETDDDPAYKVEIRPQMAEPAFVQRAKQQERYGRIGRLAMGFLILGLIPALFLQTVDAFHPRIGAMFPTAKPMLMQVCEVIECQAELPADIESVSIDSYELHSPTKSENTFTLNILLRNRSAMAQAWPYFELTLKDSTETPIVRRVFNAKEYLNEKQDVAKGFSANSEHSIKLQFEVEPPLKPVGYEVYLFYS
jgi:predicted Zn finger-like uncharacterized protein